MAKNNKLTKKLLNDNWEAILLLKAAGTSVTDIAMTYGVSRQTLDARLKKKVITNTPANPTLKTLILDIENAPMMSYHWGLWDQSINPGMRIEGNRSYMMSIAMKWLGYDEVFYYETRTEDDSELVAKVLEFLNEADLVVGHNAKKFDMKKINAYAALNGLLPPSPYRIIDTMLIAKKEFAFERNTLDYLSHALCKQTKSAHGKFKGFELWSECMKGNEEAWAEMKHYNIQDIMATEELYLVLRPWAKGHPNVTTTSGSGVKRCIACGSTALSPSGYSVSNVAKYSKYKCDDCGSYSRGRKNILTKESKEALLTNVSNG
jgi:hypothetical protein